MVLITLTLGLLNSALLFVLSSIHFYWAFGGKAGLDKSLPTSQSGQSMLNPGRVACILVALVLAAFSIMFLYKLELVRLNLPYLLGRYGVFGISLIFLVRAIGDFRYVGFTKKIKETPFGKLDTQYYSPLCLLLSLNGFILEMLLKTFPKI